MTLVFYHFIKLFIILKLFIKISGILLSGEKIIYNSGSQTFTEVILPASIITLYASIVDQQNAETIYPIAKVNTSLPTNAEFQAYKKLLVYKQCFLH